MGMIRLKISINLQMLFWPFKSIIRASQVCTHMIQVSYRNFHGKVLKHGWVLRVLIFYLQGCSCVPVLGYGVWCDSKKVSRYLFV